VAEERPLVSVVVPAWQAEATLAETVRSALAQTWREIEVIVVDDGSTDGTAAVAQGLADEDPRVSLVRKPHGGPSSARNAGIARAKGAFVAPLDADDLWHPEKIARQVEAALRPERPGFVYAFVRRIDCEGRAIGDGEAEAVTGPALHRHCYRNFVGTGSSPLFSRSALVEAGGYDEGIDRCEDYLAQMRVAARHPVAAVPLYLVGYRLTPGSLSSDRPAMFASWRQVRQRVRAAAPRLPARVLDWAHGRRCFDYAEALAWRGRPLDCLAALAGAFRHDPAGTSALLLHRIGRSARRRAAGEAGGAPGPHFLDMDPALPFAPPSPGPRFETRRADYLRRLDEAT
jgi:glycosyltransferase involved in cell wall biosynthesis